MKKVLFLVGLSLLLSGCQNPPRSPFSPVGRQYDRLNELYGQGKFQEFIDEYQSANEVERTLTLNALCTAYQKTEQFSKAIDCAYKLITSKDKSLDRFIAPTYMLLGNLYSDLGEYEKAVEVYNDIISNPDFAGYRESAEWLILFSESMALDEPAKKKKFPEVENKIKARDEQVESTIDMTVPWNRIFSSVPTSRLYNIYGQHEEVISYLDRKIPDHNFFPEYVYIMVPEFCYRLNYYYGHSLLEVGRLGEAKKFLLNGLSQPAIASYQGIQYLSLFDLGRISINENNPQEAVGYFSRAVDLIESGRSNINTDSAKMGFLNGKEQVYATLIQTLMNIGRYDEAFAYVERAKARALVDMLASKQKFGGGEVSSEEQDKLLAQLNSAEMQSRKPGPDNAGTSGKRALVRKVSTELQQQAPELSSLVAVEAPDVQVIQKLLPPGETLIEYYGSGDDLYGFVVTTDGIRGVKLDGRELTKNIRTFRDLLMQPKNNGYLAKSRALYGQLIEPLASGIHTKNLTIVPNGALHYLPFSALASNNGFLIDQYKLRILPSASVLKYLKQHMNKEGSLLALGNPDLGDASYDLPGAQAEAIRVAKDVVGSKLLLRDKATETAIKQYGGAFRYLHLASHGTFDADTPLHSGLYLAKDGVNDGMLTVGELYDMKLNADLVTLSACETGLGKVANGDDVVGLTRGFLFAGTSSIVASLWQVDDKATSDLMSTFYAELEHEDKRSALRDAQLATKAKYHHPYYWSAFQITGAI